MYMYVGLEFGFTECEIEPLSNMTCPVTLRPSKTAKYMSHVFYQCILADKGKAYKNTAEFYKPLTVSLFVHVCRGGYSLS